MPEKRLALVPRAFFRASSFVLLCLWVCSVAAQTEDQGEEDEVSQRRRLIVLIVVIVSVLSILLCCWKCDGCPLRKRVRASHA